MSKISEKSDLINKLGNLSKTKTHELLVQMMDYYDVNNLSELTLEQVRDYYLKVIEKK